MQCRSLVASAAAIGCNAAWTSACSFATAVAGAVTQKLECDGHDHVWPFMFEPMHAYPCMQAHNGFSAAKSVQACTNSANRSTQTCSIPERCPNTHAKRETRQARAQAHAHPNA
eukprot:6213133-Pleurochrysis_carterae.AAC.1